MRLTREAMLERMMASDPSFDGRFFTGVHSTGIYCLPSCRARKPKPENVKFYDTIEAARAAGLRACKKCRPDDFALGLDRDLARMAEIVSTVRSGPARFKSVEDIATFAGTSASSLFAAFRNHYTATPGSVLGQARVREAQRLLREGSDSVGSVGLAAGYETASAFYDNFGRRVGMPPAAYRRLAGASEFTIELPPEMPIGHLLRYLARDPQGTTERLTETGFEVGLWAGGVPCSTNVEISGREVRVVISSEEPPDAFEVQAQIARMFGFGFDSRPFEDHMRDLGFDRLIEGREGLRIPQSPTIFDGLVWSIVGQQVNLTFAATLRRRLAERAGHPLTNGLMAPPTARSVAVLSPDDLVPLQYSRRKAEYLIQAARSIVEGTLDLENLADEPPSRMESTLLAIRGIGPWSANYLMMRALGAPDCVPMGDTGLTSALGRFFEVSRPGPKETLELMERFRPHRSLATYHLWQSLHMEA